MKRNITINLCDRLFQIDEDAYELLQNFTDSLRSNFRGQEKGEEIVNGVEESIAKLFDELKNNGKTAININDVTDVINRVSTSEQASADAAGMRKLGKKLYRNPNDKMLNGVCSGLAAYTGTNVLIWRVIAIVLVSIAAVVLGISALGYGITALGLGILFYVLLAITLPSADTVEEQLKMQGKKMSVQNLANIITSKKQAVKCGFLRELLTFLLKIAFGFFTGVAILAGIVVIIGFLVVLMTVLITLIMPEKAAVALPFAQETVGLIEIWNAQTGLCISFIVSVLAFLFIPVYALIRSILCAMKKKERLSIAKRSAWIVLWLLSIGCAIPMGSTLRTLQNQYRYDKSADENKAVADVERDYLDANGWTVEMNVNCHNDYVKNGEYFTGDDMASYVDVWDPNAEQVFQVRSQPQDVEPGTYRVSCNARCDGKGVFIYVKTPHNRNMSSAMTEVPVFGNKGGKLWEEAGEKLMNELISPAERQRCTQIHDANEGAGFGWSPVEVIVKVDKKTTLSYGLSTWEKITGKKNEATWFSACDFKVEKIK